MLAASLQGHRSAPAQGESMDGLRVKMAGTSCHRVGVWGSAVSTDTAHG